VRVLAAGETGLGGAGRTDEVTCFVGRSGGGSGGAWA